MPAWLAGYRREWLRPDVVAGLGAAAVVIPKSLAYATIAGLPVQVGLYTACVPMAIYALLGTSRLLSVSTTTTLAILAGAAHWRRTRAPPAAGSAAPRSCSGRWWPVAAPARPPLTSAPGHAPSWPRW